MRAAAAWLLIWVLITAHIAVTPTVWRCWTSDGNWHKLMGKTHCELEGWRYLARGFRR